MELQAINSGGGAYLAMETSYLNKWPGADDMKVYDSIPFGADEGLISEVNGIRVIVLGMPDPLYAITTAKSAMLITVISCDNPDEIPRLVQSLPDQWESFGTIAIQGALTVFDSACAGNKLGEHHTLNLAAGEYGVSRQTVIGDDYEFQILKLQ